MAVERQIVIESRDASNNTITTTISSMNPSDEISNSTLYQAALKLNELTNNTFYRAYVINKTELEAS